jgi:hypothetical protein
MNRIYINEGEYKNLELSKRVAFGNENFCFEDELLRLWVERSSEMEFFEVLLFIDIY